MRRRRSQVFWIEDFGEAGIAGIAGGQNHGRSGRNYWELQVTEPRFVILGRSEELSDERRP